MRISDWSADVGSSDRQLYFLNRTRESQLDRWRADPTETRANERFTKEAREIRSLDDFMKNDTVYNLVMKAYGLEEMAFATAMISQCLDAGTADPNPMANQMVDPRYKDIARDLRFDSLPDDLGRAPRGERVCHYVRNSV